jgi:peptidoglycan hydrolase-like protein with peptidoglycan-binding domain
LAGSGRFKKNHQTDTSKNVMLKKILILGVIALVAYLIYKAVARKPSSKPIVDGGSALKPTSGSGAFADGLIKKGDKGPEVVLLQKALNYPPVSPLNYLVLDGDFGQLTENALKNVTSKTALTETEYAQLLQSRNIS